MEDQKKRKKKTIHQYMRSLHRDIGFFVIGLTVIYSLSGIVLMYPGTGVFKHETRIEKTVSRNLKADKLSRALRIKGLKVVREEGEIIHFKINAHHGTYNKTTGNAVYSSEKVPFVLAKFNKLHKAKYKANSKEVVHWFVTLFGFLLIFLAISSFWMFKPGSKFFKRGLYISIAGGLGAVILMFFR